MHEWGGNMGLAERTAKRLLRSLELRGIQQGRLYPRPDLQLAARLSDQAEALRAAKRFSEAGKTFLAASRLFPDSPRLLVQTLECARMHALSGGATSKASVGGERAGGRISVLVCSNDDARFAGFRAEIEPLMAGEDWELVRISDAKSMNEGYSRALSASRGQLLVMMHDDVGFIGADFADGVRSALAEFQLAGVAGTDELRSPAWWAAGPPHVYSRVCRPCSDGGFLLGMLGSHGPKVGGIQAIDGMLMLAHRGVIEQLGFDGSTFDGFHFYDVDLSWRAVKARLRVGVCTDIHVSHASAGNFGASWSEYGRRFAGKHWSLALPFRAPDKPIPYIAAGSRAEASSILGTVDEWLRA